MKNAVSGKQTVHVKRPDRKEVVPANAHNMVEEQEEFLDPLEQLNVKVPRGTKLRMKQLALDQGGVTMMVLFMQMFDEYEKHHSADTPDRPQ